MESRVQGGNVQGVSKLDSFWVYKTLRINIGHWTLEGFEF
jgi:hypothetical protein